MYISIYVFVNGPNWVVKGLMVDTYSTRNKSFHLTGNNGSFVR